MQLLPLRPIPSSNAPTWLAQWTLWLYMNEGPFSGYSEPPLNGVDWALSCQAAQRGRKRNVRC